MSTLETVSGRKINVLDPDIKDIDIEDIAWHLSRLPRFCGATIPSIPYSVAQHSIQVMREFSVNTPIMQMHGLLHDAGEAYIGDIPSPIKHIPSLREEIKKVESRLVDKIYEALTIPLPSKEDAEKVHEADLIQRAVEAYNFMYSRGSEWDLPKVSFKKLQEFERPVSSIEAYENFLYYYYDLKNKIV
jgi:hypothetical protein